MNWQGAGLGAAIGFVFGGPIGAGVGAAIGNLVSDNSDDKNKQSTICPHCGTNLIIANEGIIWECLECNKVFCASENIQSNDDYLTYLYLSTFGLIAKIAKIDGVVSKMEAKTISSVLDRFCDNQEERDVAKNFFNDAKNDNNDLDYYSELFYSLSYESEDMRQDVYVALFEVASADGGLEEEEKRALLRLIDLLKIDRNFYNYLYDELVKDRHSLSDYYEILGCNENSSNEEIKSAYRQKVKEFHPDKLMSKNLPEAFIKFANEQMNLFTEAYDNIRSVRNF